MERCWKLAPSCRRLVLLRLWLELQGLPARLDRDSRAHQHAASCCIWHLGECTLDTGLPLACGLLHDLIAAWLYSCARMSSVPQWSHYEAYSAASIQTKVLAGYKVSGLPSEHSRYDCISHSCALGTHPKELFTSSECARDGRELAYPAPRKRLCGLQ